MPETAPTTQPLPTLARILAQPAPEGAGWAPRTVDLLAGVIDRTSPAGVGLLEYHKNKASRAAFSAITGVKLPRTIKGSREVLAAWMAGFHTCFAYPKEAAAAL